MACYTIGTGSSTWVEAPKVPGIAGKMWRDQSITEDNRQPIHRPIWRLSVIVIEQKID